MKKLLVIFCLMAVVCAQSHAQDLKKLEDAINKMVNGKNNVNKDVKTFHVSSTPTTTNNPLTIDNLGIAGITLGGKMSSVPKSVPGLYAKYRQDEMGEQGIELVCMDNAGSTVMTIDDENEDGVIDRIYVAVKGVKIANTNIETGKPFAKIVNTPGLV